VAFRATLEEINDSFLLLHLMDVRYLSLYLAISNDIYYHLVDCQDLFIVVDNKDGEVNQNLQFHTSILGLL